MKIFPAVEGAFARYIEPARPRSELWRLGLTVAGILASFVAGSFLVAMIATIFFGPEVMYAIASTEALGASPQSIVFVLSSFAGVFLGVWLTLRVVLRRSVASVLGPDTRAFVRNTLVAIEIMGLMSALGALRDRLQRHSGSGAAH